MALVIVADEYILNLTDFIRKLFQKYLNPFSVSVNIL